jgi:hypothetical protein
MIQVLPIASNLYLTCQEPAISITPALNEFPHDLVNALADNLLGPNDGDVLIECPSLRDGGKKGMYVHSFVLKARSPYHARSMISDFL